MRRRTIKTQKVQKSKLKRRNASEKFLFDGIARTATSFLFLKQLSTTTAINRAVMKRQKVRTNFLKILSRGLKSLRLKALEACVVSLRED